MVGIFMPRMTRSSGFAALFLLVCAVTLNVQGCGSKPTKEQSIEEYSQDLREAVASSVSDGRRREQMLSIVAQLKAVNLRFSQETADFIENYRKLNADFDSPRSAFEQLFSDYSAKRVKARSEALDMHFQLTSLATESEWDKIGRAEAKLYKKVNAARPAEGAT
jgi:hypothetical protein